MKPDAAQRVQDQKALGLSVAIVSGDKHQTTEFVANMLGIDLVFGEVDPAGQVEAVEQLALSEGPFCFVGDGINDSPVLANSEIGIAMGTGTDIAVGSADIVLMSSRMENVLYAIRIS